MDWKKMKLKPVPKPDKPLKTRLKCHFNKESIKALMRRIDTLKIETGPKFYRRFDICYTPVLEGGKIFILDFDYDEPLVRKEIYAKKRTGWFDGIYANRYGHENPTMEWVTPEGKRSLVNSMNDYIVNATGMFCLEYDYNTQNHFISYKKRSIQI